MGSITPAVAVAQQMLLGGAVKQNHALEHATIVLLSKKYPEVRLAGVSSALGFFVFGDLPTEAILPAATEALGLLRSTQPDLAIQRTLRHQSRGRRYVDGPLSNDCGKDAPSL